MHNYSTIHIHLLTYVYVAPYLRQKFHWIIFCNQWLTWKHVFQTSYSGFLATLSSVSKFSDFDKLNRHLSVQVLTWLESQLKGNPWLFLRECVSTTAVGAQIRRSLRHHLLHPLILRLLWLCASANFEAHNSLL